jgi:hypothetical protein
MGLKVIVEYAGGAGLNSRFNLQYRHNGETTNKDGVSFHYVDGFLQTNKHCNLKCRTNEIWDRHFRKNLK